MKARLSLKNQSLIFISLTGFITVIVLLFLCYHSYNFADDFYHMNTFKYGGLKDFLNNLKIYYHIHDGRAYSFQIAFAWLMTGVFPSKVVTFFWLLCFIINLIILYKLIISPKRKLGKIDFSFIGLMLLFGWIGMKNHIGYNIYWATGGYMMLTGFILSLSLYILNKNEYFQDLSVLKKIVYAFIFFSLGMSAQNLSFAMAIILFLFLILSLLYKSKIFITYFYYSLMFAIGFIIVMIAPGTWQRMGEENTSFAFASIFNNYFEILFFYVFVNKVLVFFGLVTAFIVLQFRDVDIIHVKKLFYIFLLASFLVIIPFSLMPSMSFVKRAGYFYSYFAFGVSISGGILFINTLANFKFLKEIFISLTLISFLYGYMNLWIQVPLFMDLSKQIKERSKTVYSLRSKGILNITLPPIKVDDRLFTGRLIELTSDSNFLDNTRFSKFHEVEKVWIRTDND
ncbi:DUF6056 family protein [Mongoliitalea daihaiensis]|uniref:DUF6056 family protein n=1 Tax=Mongoliitalea daihaiensis TaxID=2782006 RepID=UPI001F166C3E|nr:DUF6056 family protein [Mongoliitalea daihaiensis]UJP64175.1 hypothetical protein IPZ59_15340 [Mongoliitalea daihaiensis]